MKINDLISLKTVIEKEIIGDREEDQYLNLYDFKSILKSIKTYEEVGDIAVQSYLEGLVKIIRADLRHEQNERLNLLIQKINLKEIK